MNRQQKQTDNCGGSGDDALLIGGRRLFSRLFMGTGKFGREETIPSIAAACGSEVITVALRRVDLGGSGGNILSHIPAHMQLLPNTSGARTAEEAVRIARLARASGVGNWIKIEVISDARNLLPDGYATARATEILAREGFVVLPYMNPDLYVARDLVNAGAAAVMPLGAPIGSNRGLQTREMIRILLEEIDLPIIVDAGIGAPSQACEAMEMGAAACLVNTAIATAADPVGMARAFGRAVEAGRQAYLAGLGRILDTGSAASSPEQGHLTGFLDSCRQEGGPALSRAEGDGCEPGLAPGEATSPIASVRTGRAGRAVSEQDLEVGA